MSKIIGVTGGIGSGKTTIINYIKQKGFAVYIADEAGKKIMQNTNVINQVNKLFNNEVLLPDGMLDRSKISKIVFNNKELLEKLNNIVHPAVGKDFDTFLEKNNSEKLIFKETALLFEAGLYKTCDATILITAPLDVRIKRVMLRDKVSKEEVLKRVKNQMLDEDKAKLATYIVENIDLQTAFKKIDVIIQKLLNKL